jgi:hypothetical protein
LTCGNPPPSPLTGRVFPMLARLLLPLLADTLFVAAAWRLRR